MSRLVREIEINLPLKTIEEKILSNENIFRSEKIALCELKITANVALGVLKFNYHVVDDLSISALLKSLDNNRTKITIYTGRKIGSKILIILCVSIASVSLILKYFYGHEAPLFLILLILVAPFWPRFVIRIQEKNLMDEFIKYVKLVERL